MATSSHEHSRRRRIHIGIDLGTTGTLVAVDLEDGKGPIILPNARGHASTPSLVACVKGKLFVGEDALHYLKRSPQDGASNFKRYMGRDGDEVKHNPDWGAFKVRTVDGVGRIAQPRHYPSTLVHMKV